MTRSFLIGAAFPYIMWCFAFIYAIRIMNHRYNRMIKNLPIVLWYDGNYEMKARDIFIFGSKLYAITKLEAKKQLQVRTEKDPRDYIGITVETRGRSPSCRWIFCWILKSHYSCLRLGSRKTYSQKIPSLLH